MGDLTAFVLAGGKSSRMGSDKAFLELHGHTLLARALELARSVADCVRIVGPVEKFGSYGAVVEDLYAGRGPLGGIHAALLSSATELNLVFAVDLPFLTRELLDFLVREARATEAVVTVPRITGGFQPLSAVYRRGFATLAQTALEAGKNKIDALFPQTSPRIIEEPELRRFAFDAAMFENLNAPEDLARAAQRLATLKP